MKNKQRIYKAISTLLSIVLLLFSFTTTDVLASELQPENEECITDIQLEMSDEISALNVNIKSAVVSLSISSSGTATITTSLKGYDFTTKLSANVVLKRKNGSSWTTVTSFSNSYSGSSKNFVNTYKLSNSGTYKADVGVEAKSSKGTDSFPIASNTATY